MGLFKSKLPPPKTRQALAFRCLQGIAIGDAFGESFFGERETILQHIQARKVPPTLWEFTDDTVMAIAVYQQMALSGTIDQDALAKSFARNHSLDTNRGYGATARRLLREISEGGDWRAIASSAFEGMGSLGNGAAMRVGPIGAYFFDDLDRVMELAMASAEVTHAHPEGIAGAMAIALGTALATQLGQSGKRMAPSEFIEAVAAPLPDTDTRARIRKSLAVPPTYRMETVVQVLGNGVEVSAPDTVPLAIWCAAHHLADFEEGLWTTVSALGDRDTLCAMVGGMLTMSAPPTTVPEKWQASVEKVEQSDFWVGV